MSPALQSEVWSTIGRVETVVGEVLDLFVQEGCATDADSPLVDTLASSCVPLAAGGGKVSAWVIKRILQVGGDEWSSGRSRKWTPPCHCTPPPCHCTPPPMSCPLPLCHAPSPLQVLERMPDKPGLDLDQQPSWSELAVLVRMLLYLSFQDRLDGEPAHL